MLLYRRIARPKPTGQLPLVPHQSSALPLYPSVVLGNPAPQPVVSNEHVLEHLIACLLDPDTSNERKSKILNYLITRDATTKPVSF